MFIHRIPGIIPENIHSFKKKDIQYVHIFTTIMIDMWTVLFNLIRSFSISLRILSSVVS